jgi:flavin reductase (DIM6/NTAB) family NADH-FMN oxidoreductase RutF
MPLTAIDPNQFIVKAVDIWDNPGMLLTSGDFETGHFNTMTVGWGSLGVMWSKPFVQVVVRPTRYTYGFMERYDSFTLCAFPRTNRKALSFLGSRSGRDSDKIKEAGLTPIASTVVCAPAFAEANLIFECKKMYWDDFHPANFLKPTIEKNYPLKDYHRIYFGEIVRLFCQK